jgi:hypothetical protein
MMASKRWPLKSLGWLSSNDQVKGIEYTNSAGQRIQRRWAELGRG